LTAQPPARRAVRRSNFWSSLGTIVVTILVALVIAAWFLIHPLGQAGFDARAAELCRANYHRARTAADSQMVDGQRPIVSRVQATTALTCGAMRQSGQLR